MFTTAPARVSAGLKCIKEDRFNNPSCLQGSLQVLKQSGKQSVLLQCCKALMPATTLHGRNAAGAWQHQSCESQDNKRAAKILNHCQCHPVQLQQQIVMTFEQHFLHT